MYVISQAMPDDDRERRRYFRGPLMQVNDAWRERVRARMAELGMNQAELARRIGAERSAITVLLRATTAVSRLVKPVSDVLEVATPIISADEDSSDLLGMIEQLDEEDRKRAVDFVARLRRDRGK